MTRSEKVTLSVVSLNGDCHFPTPTILARELLLRLLRSNRAYDLLKSAMGIVEALDVASSHLPSSMITKSVLWFPAEPPLICMDTKIQSPALVS